MALFLLVTVRFIHSIRNLDRVASLLLVAIGFGFVVSYLNSVAFLFAVINIDGFGAWDLNLNTLSDFDGVRLLDIIGYVNENTVRNLDIFANSLGTRDHLGDCPGDIFANLLGDLLTDRPLSSEMG